MHWLTKIDVSDVWGVGRQWAKKLNDLGVQTAADLAALDFRLIKNLLTWYFNELRWN